MKHFDEELLETRKLQKSRNNRERYPDNHCNRRGNHRNERGNRRNERDKHRNQIDNRNKGGNDRNQHRSQHYLPLI